MKSPFADKARPFDSKPVPRAAPPSKMPAGAIVTLGVLSVVGVSLAMLIAVGALGGAIGSAEQPGAAASDGPVAQTLEQPVAEEPKVARVAAVTPSRASAAAHVADIAPPPPSDDPRWADPDAPPAVDLESLVQAQGSAPEALAAFAGASAGSPDRGVTASIGQNNASASVPIAESDAEIAALEEIQEQENEVVIAALRQNGEAYSSSGDTSLLSATVTQFVNLRAGPANDAEILAVVPANAQVQASIDCRHWCETVYDGRRGYVYKSYIAVQR